MTDFTLADLAAIIAERARSGDEGSYTREALARRRSGAPPRNSARRRSRRCIAAVGEDDAALTAEAADVLYHLLVVLEARGVRLAAVMAELEKRTAQSGLAEKAARKRRALGWISSHRPSVSPLPGLPARGVGEAARRHAADPHRGRPGAAEEPQRPDLARRGGRDLPAAVAPPQPLRRRRPRGSTTPPAPSSAPATGRRPSSSASPARSRSASRPRRASSRRCSAAGRTRRRSS